MKPVYGKANVIFDGQFGSTGKGNICAYIGKNFPGYHVITTNAAPNAGHTAYWDDKRSIEKIKEDVLRSVNPGTVPGEAVREISNRTRIVLNHLPMSAVWDKDAIIYLNSGSIIDLDVLQSEINIIKSVTGEDVTDRLIIDGNASIVTAEDVEAEKDPSSGAAKVASTQKGVGSARSNKILRTGTIARQSEVVNEMFRVNNGYFLSEIDKSGAAVLIEVPQGYSLSLSGPFYPYCTSRDCGVNQALLDSHIHPDLLAMSLMTVRTFPIRVGNIPNVGVSGPIYPDQYEIDFDDIQVEPEYTTVTGRKRRIFTFSVQQFRDSLMVNRPDYVFVNFMNYVNKERDRKVFRDQLNRVLENYESQIFAEGYGPKIEDIQLDPFIDAYGDNYE